MDHFMDHFNLLNDDNKTFIKHLICIKKYSLKTDLNKIIMLIDAIKKKNNDENNDENEIENYSENDLCFCKSNLMLKLISYENSRFNNGFTNEKLHIIHTNYCSLHLSYLKKYKEEIKTFIEYKTDKWINFLESYNPTFNTLYANTPEYYKLQYLELLHLL